MWDLGISEDRAHAAGERVEWMVLGKLAVEKQKNQVRPSPETTHGLTVQIGERVTGTPTVKPSQYVGRTFGCVSLTSA